MVCWPGWGREEGIIIIIAWFNLSYCEEKENSQHQQQLNLFFVPQLQKQKFQYIYQLIFNLISPSSLQTFSFSLVFLSRLLSLFAEGILSYSIPKGTPRGIEIDLSDKSYDGHEEDDRYVEGLGQLVDGQKGKDNFRLDQGFGKGE